MTLTTSYTDGKLNGDRATSSNENTFGCRFLAAPQASRCASICTALSLTNNCKPAHKQPTTDPVLSALPGCRSPVASVIKTSTRKGAPMTHASTHNRQIAVTRLTANPLITRLFLRSPVITRQPNRETRAKFDAFLT